MIKNIPFTKVDFEYSDVEISTQPTAVVVSFMDGTQERYEGNENIAAIAVRIQEQNENGASLFVPNQL